MTEELPSAACNLARFRADLESMIESQSVVHRAPAELWEDGLYLGNGDIAATLHGGPGRTRVLLNKGDIWDERAEWLDRMYDPADFDWQRTREVLTKAVETGDWSEYYDLPRPTVRVPEDAVRNFPSFQAAGYLDIIGDLPEQCCEFRQQLSFYRAEVDASFSSADKHYAYRAYTHADYNLLAIDLESEEPGSWPLSLQLHRDLRPFNEPFEPDPYMEAPGFGHDDDTMWMQMRMLDGFGYAVVVQAPGIAMEFEPAADRITGHLQDLRARKIALRLTIVTGQDQSVAALVRRGKEELAGWAGMQEPRQAHRQWWAEYWRKGWVSLPEKVIENLWYAEIYKIACCSRRGSQAPGQFGHWCGFADPPWRGDYHTNINIQQIYWPIYCANRAELGWPFYDLYLGILDYIIEDTARYTGLPGARFVRGHGCSGRPHNRSPNWELWPGAGAWLCSHFWWHYQYTQDLDFLRLSYGIFRACLDFFIAYIGPADASGRYNIMPSLAHEQSRLPPVPGAGGAWGKNSSYDLALLREHLMHTIRASEILDVDQVEREEWRQVLLQLAPFPVSAEGWLEEWEGVSLWPSHRHLSPLYPIFPGEEIHQHSDAQRVRIGKESVLRFLARGSEGYTGFSFGWMAACAARMGMAEEALANIRNHIRAFVNVNGYSLLGASRFPGLAPYMAERKGSGWKNKLPNCESGGNFCAGINELLLRSPSGNLEGQPLICVFPAIVEAWREVRFSRLRAQGAFLVTAERRDGCTAYVLIESEAGVDCRLVNPWPGQQVMVTQGGERVAHEVDGDVLAFATRAGQTYAVCQAGSALDALEIIEISGRGEEDCLLGIGGPFEAMSWRDFEPQQ